MGHACPPTAFSIAMDGKHHDAIYSVDGDVVAVVYWAPQGVIRQETPAGDATTTPEQTARMLLRRMI